MTMKCFRCIYASIPQEVEEELPWPLQPGRGQPFDLDQEVLHLIAWPNETWVELLNVAKDEFEVDDAIAVFSTWRVQGDGGNVVLDARMTDRRQGCWREFQKAILT